MKKKTKRVVGYSPWGWKAGVIEPFTPLFTHKKSIEDDFQNIDCLLLWGGEDIHPSYYGQSAHKNNEAGPHASDRDVHEWKAMLYCKAHDIPMIGVCRGAQFITAFAGGTLIQDVSGHQTSHQIKTDDGRLIESTSVHHQMMYPYNVNHKLLAWAWPARSSFYRDGNDHSVGLMFSSHEPEVVFYPGVRGLAIQGHPEYSHATHEFKEYCVEMAKKYLFEEQS